MPNVTIIAGVEMLCDTTHKEDNTLNKMATRGQRQNYKMM